MAQQPDVNLGSVGFSLEARTESLERSMQVLNRFKDRVDRAAGGTSTMAGSFRTLSSATILAIGPLSGVGARMGVMARLFESSAAQAALLVASVTGVATTFGLLATAGVRATIIQERFDAVLATASGSAALAGDEYEYVAGVANKLGTNIKNLVEPYAKFATAARLSNVALEEQRFIFEAAMTAGTAMRLSGQRMGLVFLALEQMISKGTVTMEELRRQLGDLLPGSFELAAAAMGKTGGEFAKMIRAGEVLPKELLPKMARAWNQVFGPGAIQAAASLQAETQRFGTSVFEVNKAFDQTVGTSVAFRAAVVNLRELLTFLAKNMGEVVAITGAFMGALAGLAAHRALAVLPAAFASIVAGAVALRNALVGLATVTTIMTVLTGLVGALVRLGLIVGGSVLAYRLLKTETDELTESTSQFLKQTDLWIRSSEEIGSTSSRVAQAHREASGSRLEDIRREIQGLELQLETMKLVEQQKVRERVATQGAAPFLEFGHLLGRRRPSVPPTAVTPTEDPEVKAIQQRIASLQKLQEELQNTIQRIDALKIKDTTVSAEETTRAFDSWIKKIQEAVRENEKLGSVLRATLIDKDAVRLAEALDKAGDLMADMPKKAGNLAPIRQELEKAGFAGKTLKDQLVALFLEMERRKGSIRDTERALKDFDQAAKRDAEQIGNLTARLKAAQDVQAGADPERLREQEALNVALKERREVLNETVKSQEGVNAALDEYREMWLRVRGVELEAKRWAEFRNKVTSMLQSLEDEVARTFANFSMTGRFEWRDMLNAMAQELLTFFFKMQIVRPLFEAMFGNLTARAGGAGQGLLGQFLLGLLGGAAAGSSGTGSNVAPDVLPTAFAHTGGIIGSDNLTRLVHSNAFRGAPRLHSGGGLGAGEVPAILRRGEGVFTEEQMQHLAPASQRAPNLTVNVINQSGEALSVEKSTQPRMDAEGWVADVFVSRLSRDANLRRNVRGLISAPV